MGKVFLAALAAVLAASGAPAAEIRAAFTNGAAVIAFDGAGRAVSLKELASGRELLAGPRPFCRLVDPTGRESIHPGSFAAEGDVGVWRFSRPAGEVALSFKSFGGGWKVSVERCTVPRTGFGKAILAEFRPACTNYEGSFACMYSDDDSGVCVRSGASDLLLDIWKGVIRVDALSLEKGRALALVAGPRPGLRPALKAATKALGAPVSSCGGAWALDSERVRLSTMFGALSDASVEDVLDFCERAAMGIVHYEYWTHCYGHYPVKEDVFAGGLEGMARSSKRLHAAGLLTGIHTLTGCISNWDPWIRERTGELQPRWSYTLAEGLDATVSNELRTVQAPRGGHDLVLTYASRGNVLRIGSELIQYSDIRRERPYAFTGLVRGAFGTKAAAHGAGEACDYMQQQYIAFYPTGDSQLADDLAAAIGRVFGACEMDDIYTDGTDAFVDQRQCSLVRDKIYRALGRRDVIVESAGRPIQGWWFHSRLGTWDFPRWGVKAWQDHHVRTAEYHRRANLLAATTGWWSFAMPSKAARGQFADEAEYFAAKNAAADTATTVQDIVLTKGPAFESQVRQATVFGWYERLRRARAFSDAATAMLKAARPGEECRLRQVPTGEWLLSPQRVVKHRADAAAGTAAWRADFPKGRRAVIRVEALRAAAAEPGAGAVELVKSVDFAPKDGFRVGRTEFAYPYLDANGCEAVGAWVTGDGSGALLDLRVQSAREYNEGDSHHLLRLDFKGRRFVRFLFRERDSEYLSDRKWPFSLGSVMMANHALYRNPLDVRHLSAVECILNGPTPGAAASGVRIGPVVAMPAAKTRQRDIVLTVNGERIVLPFGLESDEYAELESKRWWKYSAAGDLVGMAPGVAAPKLLEGGNRFSYSSVAEGGAGRAEVTVFGVGRGVPAIGRADGKAREILAIEPVWPQVYRPAAGLDRLQSVAMRPGERAALSVELNGRLAGGRLEWERADGKGTRTLALARDLGGGERFICRDGVRWKIVGADRAVKAEGVLSEPLTGLAGRWRMRIGSSDPESAHVRVEMMKRYETNGTKERKMR